ncbi:MAG: hypothetical protein K8L91_22650 [Anaerolineae bacterium]|nr:hypothetical protein [Anaerolineae bacterium]
MKRYHPARYAITGLVLLLLANIALVPHHYANAAPKPQALIPFEDRSDPVLLIQSYYNAIVLRDYARAYTYWDSAPQGQTLAQFSAGFAQTTDVWVVVSTLIREGVAAGTTYDAVPTLLIASQTNGTVKAYVGCFTAKVSRVETTTDTNVADNPWSLANETSGFEEIALDEVDVNLMRTSCNPPALGDLVVDSRDTPIWLLRSYFNAVHLKDYARAYNYWSSPPNGLSFNQFVQGYANTTDIFVALLLGIQYDGAAGSTFVSMPTILIGTEKNAAPQRYYGCYVARSSNVGSGPTPPPPFWSFYSASIKVAPTDATDIELLTTPCEL